MPNWCQKYIVQSTEDSNKDKTLSLTLGSGVYPVSNTDKSTFIIKCNECYTMDKYQALGPHGGERLTQTGESGNALRPERHLKERAGVSQAKDPATCRGSAV